MAFVAQHEREAILRWTKEALVAPNAFRVWLGKPSEAAEIGKTD